MLDIIFSTDFNKYVYENTVEVGGFAVFPDEATDLEDLYHRVADVKFQPATVNI